MRGQNARQWRGILASAAFALLIGFYGWQEWIISVQPQRETNPRHANNSSGEIVRPESAEERTADYTEALARYTEALFFATAILALVSSVQIWFLIRADKTARLAAVSTKAVADATGEQVAITRGGITATERAYVFCERIHSEWIAHFGDELVTKWLFTVVWKNNGKTPTKHGITNINKWHGIGVGDLTPNFDFPDYGVLDRIVIGPDATMHAFPIEMTTEELQNVKLNIAKLYVWGWIDYDDVFADTERHRSEFCFEIIVSGNPAYKNGGFLYRRHGAFNGFDAECMKKPKPYAP